MMEKDIHLKVAIFILAIGVIALGYKNLYSTTPDYYSSDCLKEGCKDGFKCLTGISDQICVKDDFYRQYWSIFNIYQYDSCKLIIRGNPGGTYINTSGIGLSFFGMTLKECDLLKTSCMEPERYNADCVWDDTKQICACNSKPLSNTTSSSSIEINKLS